MARFQIVARRDHCRDDLRLLVAPLLVVRKHEAAGGVETALALLALPR